MAKVAGYGCWRSPISAEVVTAAQVGLAQPMLDHDVVYWLETRPEEAGRTRPGAPAAPWHRHRSDAAALQRPYPGP